MVRIPSRSIQLKFKFVNRSHAYILVKVLESLVRNVSFCIARSGLSCHDLFQPTKLPSSVVKDMSCWIESGSKLMRCLQYYNLPAHVTTGGLELRRRCSILCSLLSFIKQHMSSNDAVEFEVLILTQTQCLMLSDRGILMLKTSKAFRSRLVQDELMHHDEDEDDEDDTTSTSEEHSYGPALSYYRSLIRFTEKNLCCKVINWLVKLVATEAGLVAGAGDGVGILTLPTLSIVQTTFPFPGLTCNVYDHRVVHNNNDSVEIVVQPSTQVPINHARSVGHQLISIHDDACILPIHSFGIFTAYRSMVLDAKMEGVCLSGDIQAIQPLINLIKPAFKVLIPFLPAVDSANKSISPDISTHGDDLSLQTAVSASGHEDTSRWDYDSRPVTPGPQELALIMLAYFGGDLSTAMTIDTGYDATRLSKPRTTSISKENAISRARGGRDGDNAVDPTGDNLYKLPTKRQSRLSLTTGSISTISTIEDSLPTSVKRNIIMIGAKRILLVGSNRHVGELRNMTVHGDLIQWGIESGPALATGSGITGLVTAGSTEVVPTGSGCDEVNVGISLIELFSLLNLTHNNVLGGQAHSPNELQLWFRTRIDMYVFSDFLAEDCCDWLLLHGVSRKRDSTGKPVKPVQDSSKDDLVEHRSERSVTYSFVIGYLRQLLELPDDASFNTRVRTTQWLLDLLNIYQRLDDQLLHSYLTDLPHNSCYKSELHLPSPVERFCKPPKNIYVMPLPTKPSLDSWQKPILMPSASAASRLVNSPTYNVLNNCSYAVHILNQLVRLPASQLPSSQQPSSESVHNSGPTAMLETTEVTLIAILPKGIPSNEPVDRQEDCTQNPGSMDEDVWEQVQNAISTDYNTIREQLDAQVQLSLVSYFWLEDSYCAGAPLDPLPYRVKIAYGSTFQLVNPKAIDFTNSCQDVGDEPTCPTPDEGGGSASDEDDEGSEEDCSDRASNEANWSDGDRNYGKQGELTERRRCSRYSSASSNRSKRLRLWQKDQLRTTE